MDARYQSSFTTHHDNDIYFPLALDTHFTFFQTQKFTSTKFWPKASSLAHKEIHVAWKIMCIVSSHWRQCHLDFKTIKVCVHQWWGNRSDQVAQTLIYVQTDKHFLHQNILIIGSFSLWETILQQATTEYRWIDI